MQIINFRRIDRSNPGDALSSPLHYFDFSAPAFESEIWSDAVHRFPESANIIVGGGGLLGGRWIEQNLNLVLSRARGKLVLWGAGHNRHFSKRGRRFAGFRWGSTLRRLFGRRDFLSDKHRSEIDLAPEYALLEDKLRSFSLAGIRDFGLTRTWVPCPSCMHPLLDVYRRRKPVDEVVVYDHPRQMRLNIAGYKRRHNIGSSFESALDLLSQGDVIVTSSYHGAYWGTLLNRKVVVVPWSTKFYGFKHRPQFCWEPDRLQNAVHGAREYPEALAECREANTNFARAVAELFETDVTYRLRGSNPGTEKRSKRHWALPVRDI